MTLTVILVMTFFCLGFVIGMLVIHFTYSNKEQENGPVLEIATEEEKNYIVKVPERRRVLGTLPVNPYNPDGFKIEDGFMAYYDENGNKISHLGIDLSYHQQNVNWDELAMAPIEFVFLRVGYRGYSEGGLIEDEKFREYATAANERDIPLGVYFYSQAITVEEAQEEARFVLDLIKDYNISYPVVFDTEYVADSKARTNVAEMDRELRTDICLAFVDCISEQGYYPMIYASENWIRRNLNYEDLQEYDFWAPQYLDQNDFLYDFTIWQYTESGNFPGVSEEVDINISMIDYASFVPQLREAYLNDARIVTIPDSETILSEDMGD